MNAPVTQATTADLKKRSSKALGRVLDEALPSLSDAGGFITVASFIHTAAQPKDFGDTAATVARNLFSSSLAGLTTAFKLGSRAIGEVGPVSEGLAEAFTIAREVREATGGKDRYIGLRHVLFAIAMKIDLTMTTKIDGALAEEVEALAAAATSVEWPAFREAIAEYCITHREPQERLSAWRNLLSSWGLARLVPQDSPDTPPPPPRRDPEVALLQPDDAWSGEVNDCTGALSEAQAFADMVCATQFQPPLAVAVFGEWGSGKSFFMRLLYDAVAENARQARAAKPLKPPSKGKARPAGSEGGITFHKHVVQIRFNAWHYAETNLWASLVDQIFSSLSRWTEAEQSAEAAEKLFERLTTAQRLTIEAAEGLVDRRRERNAAQTRLVKAEKALAERRAAAAKSPQTYAEAAFRSLRADPDVSEKLETAGAQLGLKDLGDNLQTFREAASALDDEVSRFALFRSGVARELARPLIFLGIAGATLALPALLAWLGSLQSQAMAAAAAVSGFVAPTTVAFGWAARQASGAVDVVRTYRRQFEAHVEAEVAADKARVDQQAAELAAAKSAARDAADRLKLASERAVEAEREYLADNGRGRVLKFVRDRMAEGGYAKHLSFVATVRKDFEELSRLMSAESTRPIESTAARKAYVERVEKVIRDAGKLLDAVEATRLRDTKPAPESAEPPAVFERIVLYIDDLDRCPPEQVVAVLQAVHLLLTFPLFVVFVAVDIRWLRTSLIKAYPEQFGKDAGPDGATPSDYLEKLFQIPYWVRPMGLESTQAVIADRIGPEPTEPAAADAKPDAAAASAHTVRAAATPQRRAKVETKADDRAEAARRAASLQLNGEEWRFIHGRAATLDGLPRRTLRFVNTYRIIKGSLDAAEVVRLEAGGHRALIALLAIAIVADEEFPRIAAMLAAGATSEDPIDPEAIVAAAFIGSAVTRARVLGALQAALPASGDDFAHYVALAARFSFHEGLHPAVATPA